MANTPQELFNSAPSIDPAIGITSGGISDSVNLANSVLNNPTSYDFGEESLSESLKRVSQLKTPKFTDIYKPSLTSSTLPGGYKIDPFGSYEDTSETWVGDKVDLNQYYNQTGESWSNLDKDNAQLIGVGGGVLAGAATGAAIGSLGGPVGTAIGAVVGGILGGIEGNQVSKNIGYGYVRNKYGYDENAKFNEQGFLGRAGAGVMNMVHSADSLTLGTLGTIAYIPDAISERSLNVLFNNDFTKLLDDYDKSSQSSNRIYHSDNYTNSSLIGKLGNSELWFEQVAPAVGFMIGAIGVGRATGLGLGAVGLGASATGGASRAFLAETVASVAKGESQVLGRQALLNGFKEAARQDLKNQTFKSMASNMVTLLTSASPESGLEARGAMNEARENYLRTFSNAYGRLPTSEEINNFEQSNKEAGNGVFTANLAVVGMSNWLQFGDAMGINRVIKKDFLSDSIDKVFGLGIKKTLGEVSEKGVQSAIWGAVKRTKLQNLGYRTLKALESPLTEGVWEEGIQHVISGTHKNYLESRFNPQATEINKSLISSFGESFVNTYTTEEGWNDIMIGMIVGAGGTARVRGGVDFLNQREVSNKIANINSNVSNLNETQKSFIEAQEDYLQKQAIYNNLTNDSTIRLQDKIGGLNQQLINSDMSKKFIASGNLEQAQLAYQNAMFAKLSAEKRAGLSASNKFDMDTMVDNIPGETLTELYNFRSPEQISQFKEETQTNLNNLIDSFDASYEMAESLNLGTNSGNFSPAQVTEMAALNFFHGMHSADNANNLAKAIEGSIGINGIADSMNYYANLSKIQQNRISELQGLQEQLTELEDKHSNLLNNFSTEVVKPQREGENQQIVTQLDRTNNQLEAVQSEIESVNSRINSLTNILNSKEAIPSLPFGNPSIKFFDSINLKLADTEVTEVLSNLKSLDNYIDHLLDSTEKSEEDTAIDRNKAEILQSLVDSYKAQMALMRNFAKTAQMVTDPSYMNNLSKGIFNSKKYDTLFDNTDWITNNESGFDELSKEQFKQLKEKLDSGIISKYDVHTFLTNAEILRMGVSSQQGNTVSLEEEDVISSDMLREISNQDEEGNITLDVNSETYKEIFEDLAQDLSLGTKLSPNQELVYDAIKSNEEQLELLNERINQLRSETEVSPSTMGQPDRNSKLAEQQRLIKIAEDKKQEVNSRYDAQIGEVVEFSNFEPQEFIAPIENKSTTDSFNGHNKADFTNSNTQQIPIIIDGNLYNVVTGMGRAKTLITINGVKIPFYLTSGLGGKGLVEGWYPFFGVGNDGWLNKTDKSDMETYYERYWGPEVANLIKQASEDLNRNYGTDPKAFENDSDPTTTVRPITSLADKVEDFINDSISIKPTINDVNARKNLRANVEKLGQEILNSNLEESSIDNDDSNNIQEENVDNREITLEEGISQIENRIGQLESERQKELDAIDAQLAEALNPTETRSIQIGTELDKLNAFIENVINQLKSASKELNTNTVDNFDLNPKKVSQVFSEYEKLFNKEDRTNNDEARLAELKNKINKYGLLEGRVVDYEGATVRLSDILEQRVFLENEQFNTESELDPLSDNEQSLVTTESPTDEFTAKTKGGDPTVLNNYDFATFTGANSNNEVVIANITPNLVLSELVKDKEEFSIEVDNKSVDLEDLNTMTSPGQLIKITFNDINGEINRVVFQLDNSRRIILPTGDISTLESNSGLRFNSSNIIGSSGYYTLTRDVDGVQVPVRSDFDLAQLIDSESAQRLTPGDALYFEVEQESEFNQSLMDKVNPFISAVSEEDLEKIIPSLELASEAVANVSRSNVLKSNIVATNNYINKLNVLIEEANDAGSDAVNLMEYNKNVVYPLIDKVDAEHKKLDEFEAEISTIQNRNKEIRTILNVDYSKIPFDKIVRNLEKKLEKSKLNDTQKKQFDTVRKEFKDNMVIVSKDKSGNVVGVVKSLNNSNGQNAGYMDYLRSNLFEQLEKNNFKGARSSYTVPVQIVYMGVPNISSVDGTKVMLEFSNGEGQNTINPSKISDIGYVTHNQMKFNSGSSYTTPYNYAQSIFKDKNYIGRKVPVVMFKYNGKDIIYPVTLKNTLNSDVVISQFEELQKDKSKDFSTYLNDINEFLSENGISPKYRLTSLNHSDSFMDEIKDVISNSEFYPSVEEFLDSRNIRETLIENALIDIDLNNRPFIGPKIKIGLNQVPEFTSDISNSDSVISDESPIKTAMDDEVDNNECNIELD